ncbi:MAG: pirin family protein [Promethearchaeota archaeon]|nr:MAG: pirin family protein [Candidatus Lokiarchaeota archaeon]
MSKVRKIKLTLKARPTIEGAGVRLKRVFGNEEVPLLDPFLLLDHFGSKNPEDYVAGFPWHPHRGIETITYMLNGKINHGDSLGNKGVINSGDVQWMTAGSGIIHSEMPQETEGMMMGFQLWANLPASEKMMDPRYRDVLKTQIPTVELNEGVKVRIICGKLNGVEGPVNDIMTDPEYIDVIMSPNSQFEHVVKEGYTVFAYLYNGKGFFDENRDPLKHAEELVIYDDGDEIVITSIDGDLRFLLVSGKPLNEPVAWYGPIVMNTQDEIRKAFEEYRNGTFIKHKPQMEEDITN